MTQKLAIVGLVSLIASVLGLSSDHQDNKPPLTELQRRLEKEALIVHEWGVFTIFNDVKFANINRAEEWGSLPDFFYRQFPNERLHWVPAGWDKPIIYFYTKYAGRLEVKVTFAEGAPVVWWPAVAQPVNGLWPTPTGRSNVPHRSPLFRSLTWNVAIGDPAQEVGTGIFFMGRKPNPTAEFSLPASCWLNDARLPDAALVTAIGTPVIPRLVFGGGDARSESERFIYYDGLVPAPEYLRCENVDDCSVTLQNRANFDLRNVFIVDRRAKDVIGFAYLDGVKKPFPCGERLKIKPQKIDVKDWPAAGMRQVRLALLDSGLFEAEADSLLKIWRKGFFENGGVTVFHIMPQKEYDRMLPLEIRPTPVKPVRVGIAFHPHVEIEPALSDRVSILFREIESSSYPKRAAAAKELLEIGPLAIASLQAELKKNVALETRRRIEAVISSVDALKWLDTPPLSEKPKQ